ncbi:MAG: DUF1304 domain-containing protein [Micrococcaceae bacterium]
MIITGIVLAIIAALIHVYIFYMESIQWTAPKTRAVFGTTEDEARITKQLAFNQGFYNLFLALLIFIGSILYFSTSATTGLTLIFAGAGSMVAASLVLFFSNIELRSAALKQGLVPALGIIALSVGLLLKTT